jgi:hypothetical protein
LQSLHDPALVPSAAVTAACQRLAGCGDHVLDVAVGIFVVRALSAYRVIDKKIAEFNLSAPAQLKGGTWLAVGQGNHHRRTRLCTVC